MTERGQANCVQEESFEDILKEMRIFKCRDLSTGKLEVCSVIASYFANRLQEERKRMIAAHNYELERLREDRNRAGLKARRQIADRIRVRNCDVFPVITEAKIAYDSIPDEMKAVYPDFLSWYIAAADMKEGK